MVAPLLFEWFKINGRMYSWRETNRSPYEVLVAEVLLKRTTAAAASRLYGRFLNQFPNMPTIKNANLSELESALAPVGLQKQRALGLKAMAEFLVNRFGGKVPDHLDDLLEVPHIGEYSARAIMSFGHDRPFAVVDSNVVRVLGRVFSRSLGENPTLHRYQTLADSVLPVETHKAFNWGIIDLGALVCRYDRPKCGDCPFISICDSSGVLNPMLSV